MSRSFAGEGGISGQVSSQVEMDRDTRRSKVQEKARVIVSCSGVAEITWVENLETFKGRRGGGMGSVQSAG